MKSFEEQYLDLLRELVKIPYHGVRRDRTGVGTKAVFSRTIRHDLSMGFPLLTSKYVPWKSTLIELLGFIRGYTTAEEFEHDGCAFWNPWKGRSGVIPYGAMWRDAPGGVDQLKAVIEGIKSNPYSRRHLVDCWQTARQPDWVLPPCHFSYQFFVTDGKLSCQFNMRSSDVFLGLPCNLPSYAFLTHMVAQQCGMGVGELVWNGVDVHLYQNHIEQAQEQLSRTPRPLPTMRVNRKPDCIDDYRFEDFELAGYDPHPAIKAPMAV